MQYMLLQGLEALCALAACCFENSLMRALTVSPKHSIPTSASTLLSLDVSSEVAEHGVDVSNRAMAAQNHFEGMRSQRFMV